VFTHANSEGNSGARTRDVGKFGFGMLVDSPASVCGASAALRKGKVVRCGLLEHDMIVTSISAANAVARVLRCRISVK
jgi:hypothetical protein